MADLMVEMNKILDGPAGYVPNDDETFRRKELKLTTKGGYAIDSRRERRIGEMSMLRKVCKALYNSPIEWNFFHEQTVEEGLILMRNWREAGDELLLGAMDGLFSPEFNVYDNREVVAHQPYDRSDAAIQANVRPPCMSTGNPSRPKPPSAETSVNT